MSTLTEAAAACCACIRVRWVTTRHETGEVSGRWVCSSCERAFVPASVARAEFEQLRDTGAAALDAAGEVYEDMKRRLTEVTAQLDRIYALPGVSAQGDRSDVAECVEALIEHQECRITETERLGKELGREESRADYIRDQAEIASLRIDVADLRNQRDQCHLRAQTAEVRNEELQRRVAKLEEVLERTARCLITPNPAITDTLWLDPSPRGPHITLYEYVCGHLGREVKPS